ncbi:ABC transporter ATP-binding protein [Anaerocolumna chitinilytica]|uniref:ABC transporter ATPase n=1 Tax=Anaerocolumna chitinilytica TaxID=1727145 RepID=A0A7M3SAA4_9FIRM|nr:ABC transporter ATP-binding protein [Anaerocolumna chitinilytica]BCK01522.1 ABC transporter ATPase [Anaerocolumna chitinilytica]
MEVMLKCSKLSKSYKEKVVLKGIDFEVYKGEILCILGPNGAGKSTTINILTASLSSNGGEISFKGRQIKRRRKDLTDYKQVLGIVPQDIALYEELSAERNLRFFASLYGLQGETLNTAVEEALAFAGLTDRRKDKVKTFSGGMKRRLNIACAIAHKPELVIMDEPTVGIDPQSRNHILDSIRRLQENGMTVIYTTHYMEEVEAISTRIIIMDYGAIIAEGTKEDLKESIGNDKRYTIELEERKKIQAEDLFSIEGVKNVKIEENILELSSLKGIENLDRIIALLSDQGEKIKNITSEATSLETVFLKLTGRKLRD